MARSSVESSAKSVEAMAHIPAHTQMDGGRDAWNMHELRVQVLGAHERPIFQLVSGHSWHVVLAFPSARELAKYGRVPLTLAGSDGRIVLPRCEADLRNSS